MTKAIGIFWQVGMRLVDGRCCSTGRQRAPTGVATQWYGHSDWPLAGQHRDNTLDMWGSRTDRVLCRRFPFRVMGDLSELGRARGNDFAITIKLILPAFLCPINHHMALGRHNTRYAVVCNIYIYLLN